MFKELLYSQTLSVLSLLLVTTMDLLRQVAIPEIVSEWNGKVRKDTCPISFGFS